MELNIIQPVPSFIFLYSEENKLLFVKKFNSLCVPRSDLGSNYFLDSSEQEKLIKNGKFIQWDVLDKLQKIETGNYKELLSIFLASYNIKR